MGGGQSATELDPRVGLKDAIKPLRSKLLAVPALRERYLKHVRTIAEKNLDWKNLGAFVAVEREAIEKEIAADTRKLTSLAAFNMATSTEAPASNNGQTRRREPMSLKAFADKRRAYLMSYQPKSETAAQPAGEQLSR